VQPKKKAHRRRKQEAVHDLDDGIASHEIRLRDVGGRRAGQLAPDRDLPVRVRRREVGGHLHAQSSKTQTFSAASQGATVR